MAILNRRKKASISSPPHYRLDSNTPFHITEAYKQVRTNLLFSLAAKDSKTVVVSSAIPTEGKSTTCANLAITMAQTGSRVLLIDADLRKPVQHKLFGLPNNKGLSTILVGFHSADESISQGVEENLDILPAGIIPPNPSEMVGSSQMKVFIEKMLNYYSCIFIDSPPVNVVTDAAILASQAAGIILVARQRYCTYAEYKKASEVIQFAGATILGTVINRTRSDGLKLKGYKAYNYEYTENSK